MKTQGSKRYVLSPPVGGEPRKGRGGFFPRWRGCLKGGGGFLLLLMFTTFMSLPSCHTKSSLTHTKQSTEKDSNYVSLLEQKLDSITRYSSRIRTEKTELERTAAATITKESGIRIDTLPITKERFVSGNAYVDIWYQGVVSWGRAKFHIPETTSTHTEVKDSSAVIESRYQKQLKQKDQFIQELENQIEVLESRKVKTVWPLKEMIGGGFILLAIGVIVGWSVRKR